ncbi:glycosyltransferase [Nesterenkonia sp. K-15-9-6]|uniref:glycosyltransferase n=1 Tax=Nesterenkonia sp. K-15-9-6 TaxID=3093918 RepID=UPI004043D81A
MSSELPRPEEQHPTEQPPEDSTSASLITAASAHDDAAAALARTRRPEIWAPLAQAHGRRASAMRARAAEQDPADTPITESAQSRATARRAIEEALEAAAALPSPEEGATRPRLRLRIGIICDRFLFDTFSGIAELIPLTPTTWRRHLHDVDVLLVAATWRGHDGSSWDVTGAQARRRRRLLTETLIPAYRRAGVPTVYYGKEDPPDYRQFLDVARACEHILTTAAEMVESYQHDCPGARSIEVMPFAVNPLLHSPLGSRPAAGEPNWSSARRPVLFAGSWMGRKYPERAAYARWIFDGVLQAGRPLAVVDRYHDVEVPTPNQLLPYEYWPYRVPAIDHRRLMDLQRVTDVAINLNSVLASQTMFANRALELQAASTLVLSTYNQGLNSYHPQVRIANSATEVAASLRDLDLETLRRAQGDGVRQVFLENHGADLLARLARIVGLTVELPGERVLAVAEAPTEQLRTDFATQSRGAVDVVSWEELPQRAAEAEILLPVSPARRYDPEYVADHTAALRFQSAGLTVKLDGDAASTDPLAHRHHRFDLLGGQAGALELAAVHRPADRIAEGSLSRRALTGPQQLASALQDERAYALDHLQHRVHPQSTVQPRTDRRQADRLHSLEVSASDEEPALKERAPEGDSLAAARRMFRSTAEDHALQLAVIVPIYNNGHHLRHKAFASLRRSASFEQMHVLLIDDGSTDGTTAAVVDELARTYPNVSAFHHGPGGSGSASRPRNTGLELTFTPFVTYLDPDDEQHEDGYIHLMERLHEAEEADFALGTQITWTHRRTVLDVHRWLNAGIPEVDGLRRPEAGSLRAVKFRPASIEGLVARTYWLKSLGLTQPVGATGQDTFFFQQMLHHTKAYVAVPDPVYVYYGAVDTSIVNVVTPKYFRKYQILEAARAAWLRETGLMQDYLETRFEHFLVTWYLWKLTRVAPVHRREAEEILRQIIMEYVPDPWSHRWRSPKALRFFGLANPQQVLRGRLPAPAALRPALGAARDRLRAEASAKVGSFKGSPPGRALGAVYRRTIKPEPTAQLAMMADLREDQRRLEAADGPWESVMAAEDAVDRALQSPAARESVPQDPAARNSATQDTETQDTAAQDPSPQRPATHAVAPQDTAEELSERTPRGRAR